jgi:hypothetical protein
MVLELAAILAATRAGTSGSVKDGIGAGVALAGCVLVRQVGVCLVAAALVDLGLRRRWQAVAAAGATVVMLIVPWAAWQAVVRHNTQAEFLLQDGLADRIAGQAAFYLQRIPDQITGPLVEIATVFHRLASLGVVVNLWAVLATGVTIWGWARTLPSQRRRLAGLVAFITLALLLVWPFAEAGRFLIPLVPFLLVGATEGLARVAVWVRMNSPRNRAAAMLLLFSVPYAAYAVATGRAAAQRLTHSDFDRACQWLAGPAARPGLVMTRHPGEVFWQTRRQAVAPEPADPTAIARRIDRLGITYLLIDEDRYANQAESPLARYVRHYPDRAALVWSRKRGMASTQIWETRPTPR